jgi:ABC-type transport system substrate-binding protein
MMGFTNLGLVQYQSFKEGELEGAFASKWEQPSGTKLVLTLRDGLTWQNKPPVNGRAATVDDIVSFIERNRQGKLQDGTDDVNFYRKAEYANVDSVVATDAKTVTVTFKKEDPFFLGTLASAYAKIQAPEAIKAFEKDYANLKADLIIGTGPYVLTDFKAEGSLSFRKFDKFNAWETYIEGIDYFPLFTDNTALQNAFEQKQIDEYGPRTKAVLDDLLNKYKGQLADNPNFSANPMAGTYWGGSAPWNNPNLIGAIFRSIDRRGLIEQMFQGRAALAGNIRPRSLPSRSRGGTHQAPRLSRGPQQGPHRGQGDVGGRWRPVLGEIIVDIRTSGKARTAASHRSSRTCWKETLATPSRRRSSRTRQSRASSLPTTTATARTISGTAGFRTLPSSSRPSTSSTSTIPLGRSSTSPAASRSRRSMS